MKNLIIIKDEKGNVKLSQYSTTENDLEREIDTLKTFFNDSRKVYRLKSFLPNLVPLTASELISFTSRLLKQNKKESEYFLKFLDSEIDLDILENIINSKNSSIKIIKYPYSKDFIAFDNLFEIDYQKQKVSVISKGRSIISFDFKW